ncbi:GntR family transcriptional regulator [Jeotgalibacillus sp. S-D1]|nr:GntR family transcriptional regulator [Jeotgalibacillus sp. S-D1]
MLDKQSPLPMYAQIAQNLKKKIQKGMFQAGSPIPSERELTETYEVSRMTVRQAITNLVNEGLLYRAIGKGTFVSEEKIEQPLQGLTSFTEDMKARGMTPGSEMLEFYTAAPPSEVTVKLQLHETDQVVVMKRIRHADSRPMAIETTYIPVTLFSDLNQEAVKQSFYAYIQEKKQLTISHARQTIEAAIAKKDEAALLLIREPSAVLQIERLSYLTTGIPFELVRSTYRADRYKFQSENKR